MRTDERLSLGVSVNTLLKSQPLKFVDPIGNSEGKVCDWDDCQRLLNFDPSLSPKLG